MKHIGKELYQIIDKKRLVKRHIAEKIGMDPSRFNQYMHKETMDARLLEKICKVIGVSPGYFFDDWPSEKYTIGDISNQTFIGDAQVNIGLDKKHLEEIIMAKNELIGEKERVIKILSMKSGIEL